MVWRTENEETAAGHIDIIPTIEDLSIGATIVIEEEETEEEAMLTTIGACSAIARVMETMSLTLRATEEVLGAVGIHVPILT